MTATTVRAAQVVRICEQDRPTWREACWIGVVDEDDLVQEIGAIPLDGAQRFGRARLLVRSSGVVRGFVSLEVTRGRIDARRLRRQIRELDSQVPPVAREHWPAATVVLCERGRGERIARAVRAVLDSDYPNFEVLVIGRSADACNRSSLVDQYGPRRVVWVDGMDEGIGRARNRGLQLADGSFIAFTDDRVLVDRSWLRTLASGFARALDVACVTGLTARGELSTRWHGVADTLQSDPAPEPDIVRTPLERDVTNGLHTDIDGTHRNFAVNRKTALDVGGWDARLWQREPIAGGEDVDVLVRILQRGLAVAYEPSAVAFSFD